MKAVVCSFFSTLPKNKIAEICRNTCHKFNLTFFTFSCISLDGSNQLSTFIYSTIVGLIVTIYRSVMPFSTLQKIIK